MAQCARGAGQGAAAVLAQTDQGLGRVWPSLGTDASELFWAAFRTSLVRYAHTGKPTNPSKTNNVTSTARLVVIESHFATIIVDTCQVSQQMPTALNAELQPCPYQTGPPARHDCAKSAVNCSL